MELQVIVVESPVQVEKSTVTTRVVEKIRKSQSRPQSSNREYYSKDDDENRDYEELVNTVRLDKDVLDGLISKCLLTIEDREEIIKEERQSERNKMIIDSLKSRPFKTFEFFMEALIDADQHNAHFKAKIKNFETAGTDSLSKDIVPTSLSNHKIKLQKNFKRLVHGLAFDSLMTVLDILETKEVISSEERFEVCAPDTKEERIRRFVATLMYKSNDVFNCFLSALKEDSCYDELVRLIEYTDVTDDDKRMLQMGRIVAKKKKDLYTKEQNDRTDNIIPEHIQDQHNAVIEQWIKEDTTFVDTRATDEVLKKIRTNTSVTLSGNSGTGKTATMKHIALLLKKEGYRIVPVCVPEDIRNFAQKGVKTLFVIDDVCGHFTLKEQQVDKWEEILTYMEPFLKENPFKLIATCRLQVFTDPTFKKVSLFSTCECNLNSESIKLTAEEKSQLADMYCKELANEVKEFADQFEFFPLLCKLFQTNDCKDIKSFFKNPFQFYKNDIEGFKVERETGGKLKYCCLVLCVIFNNSINDKILTSKETHIRKIIEETLDKCKLDRGPR